MSQPKWKEIHSGVKKNTASPPSPFLLLFMRQNRLIIVTESVSLSRAWTYKTVFLHIRKVLFSTWLPLTVPGHFSISGNLTIYFFLSLWSIYSFTEFSLSYYYWKLAKIAFQLYSQKASAPSKINYFKTFKYLPTVMKIVNNAKENSPADTLSKRWAHNINRA